MDGVFQREIEGGKGVCEEERYDERVFACLYTHTHTHTHTSVCCHAVLCNQFYISVCGNICGVLPSSVLMARKKETKKITLIQLCSLIHVPNSACTLTFTYAHFPLPS